MVLGLMSGYSLKTLPKVYNEKNLDHLLHKANLYEEVGGAKLASVFTIVLLDIFAAIDEQTFDKSKILAEMVMTMGVSAVQNMNPATDEGPRREPSNG